MELRNFIDFMGINDLSFRINDNEWEQIENLHDILKECYIFTQKTQAEQMTMSDFYADWIALKLMLKKKTKCEFASNLIQFMTAREKNLFGNSTVLAALFLDSRYRLFLKDKPMEKHTAMTHLTCVWKRLEDLKPVEERISNANDVNTELADDVDELDILLSSLENAPSSHIQSGCDKIAVQLQKFDDEMANVKRDERSKHPMDFWESKKNKYPDIYQIACVIFAAAPTEVSVERCFSGLAFILNKYRCSLTDENLNNILFIRLNKAIFKNIVDV